jgi:hypothetical protein
MIQCTTVVRCLASAKLNEFYRTFVPHSVRQPPEGRASCLIRRRRTTFYVPFVTRIALSGAIINTNSDEIANQGASWGCLANSK